MWTANKNQEYDIPQFLKVLPFQMYEGLDAENSMVYIVILKLIMKGCS